MHPFPIVKHTSQENKMPLRLAILGENTLIALGLKSLLEKLMPSISVDYFSNVKQISPKLLYVHYFVMTQTLLNETAFFLKHSLKTIVLLQQESESNLLPAFFHTLMMNQSETKIIESLIQLQHRGHAHKPLPQITTNNTPKPSPLASLTPRETEVLKLIVQGNTNKVIAQILNIGLATVISHRKHLIEKLGLRSVSSLTVFAVAHGLVSLEEVKQ